MSESNTVEGAARNPRKRRLLILAAVVAIVGLVYGAYWLLVARYYESTDDAYVAGDIVQVTSEIPGTVIAVHVDDTQTVAPGQILVELDPADARIATSGVEAQLARTVRQVRATYAQAEQLRSQITQRDTELKQAEQDYARRQTLVADGAVSGEELAHARDTIAQLRAAVDATHRQLDAVLAQIEGTTLETHPEVLAAAAKLRDVALSLHRTRIVAPVAGVVAKRAVQLGQHVAAGAPLMAVVQLNDVWVDANFKEVQLTDVRIGQPVELEADIYGGSVEYHGKIAGVSAGSGSAFALLPSQNASGNWIKIVQRLPVRIALDSEEVKQHPLRVGLSMHAKIDLHDTSGPLVSDQVRTTRAPAHASDADDPAIAERIATIIQENASGKQSTPRASRLDASRTQATPVSANVIPARSGTVVTSP
jgi:membrane fusion protein (multidrug efflux system)